MTDDPEPLGPLRPAPMPDGSTALRLPRPLPPCRACGFTSDAVTLAGPGRVTPPPEPGAYLICMECGEVSVVVDGPLGLAGREPTTEELAEFNRDHGHIARARAQVVARYRRWQQR